MDHDNLNEQSILATSKPVMRWPTMYQLHGSNQMSVFIQTIYGQINIKSDFSIIRLTRAINVVHSSSSHWYIIISHQVRKSINDLLLDIRGR